MHTVFEDITRNFEKSGELSVDVAKFLEMHGCVDTVKHVNDVAQEARELAPRFLEKAEDAFCAGLLHDISAVFPNKDRVRVATELGIDILPEEKTCPAILHQRISEVMAKEIFGITDQNILSAMGCHTTLKENASTLDKIVFISDKIMWDQEHSAPYQSDVLKALEISLDEACFCYLNYLWQQKESLAVVHPWMEAAYKKLNDSLGK
ncbi:HAD family hydrolase [Candidatus Campbellbacteria bacterium RIFOXYC2_FULL_35_25]|uniref:bis(5'-nucleosyl)-tetraphosphatase (symmetrical) n=1 Tax=Candidatus Campbellbacteria bacterium RIFOXYC2_FULL_35_25 TaxID=1797582 RepID=A0A1F5EHG0_9BACT|nr:MAG: HAD family hydrolase [Candidatus Campbellbacteria bacterium RIFOXYC2_FULL_35_25]